VTLSLITKLVVIGLVAVGYAYLWTMVLAGWYLLDGYFQHHIAFETQNMYRSVLFKTIDYVKGQFESKKVMFFKT
jgi:hypothetical protein